MIAGQLKARKLENIARLRVDAIAAGNIGCLTQLAGGVPTIHTVELLDWMAGGPKPDGLDGAPLVPEAKHVGASKRQPGLT